MHQWLHRAPTLTVVAGAQPQPLHAILDELDLLADAVDRAAADLAGIDPVAATRGERRLAGHVRAIAAALEPLRTLVAGVTTPHAVAETTGEGKLASGLRKGLPADGFRGHGGAGGHGLPLDDSGEA